MVAGRIVVLLGALLAMVGCATGGATESTADEQAPRPSWILDLSPQPGAQWSVDERIEVTFDVPSDESVRLTIDDTDVTDDAELDDGQLTYDAQQAPTAIDLGSGEHTATVERVRTGSGSENDVPVDSYTWSFEIP